MSSTVNRQWTLGSRPKGWPLASDFELAETAVPEVGDGQLLLRSLYLSVDPYMRGRMRGGKGYTRGVELGELMVGGAVARVVESRHPDYSEGDIVEWGLFGWQDYAVSDGTGLRIVDPELAPISTALGILGMPGLTAYFGLLDVCELNPKSSVVVSGAAGAVGSVVGQIAKIHDCRCVGIAGTDEKTGWLTGELGFDSAINYKQVDNWRATLTEHCPDGVDAYFDNVGGPITDAVIEQLNIGARVAICGQISQYNNDSAASGPRNLVQLIIKRARIEGFLIFDYADRAPAALAKLASWIGEGKLQYRETVVDGLENAPEAFISMMRGANLGKMLVKVAD